MDLQPKLRQALAASSRVWTRLPGKLLWRERSLRNTRLHLRNGLLCQPARAPENIRQHLFRELSGGGILLAGMVRAYQYRLFLADAELAIEIGRASCRERVQNSV